MDNQKIVIVDGARTPVGSFGGALMSIPAHELGATAVRAALERAHMTPDDVETVVMGCIGQVGSDAYNARRVGIAAGLPDRVPALTVNRLCGSGLQAVWSAAMEMTWSGLDIAVAGGDESMSRMPFYDFGARDGYELGDRQLADGTVLMLTDPFSNVHMGVTAENVARKYSVSRLEQDEFAAESQRRAAFQRPGPHSKRRSPLLTSVADGPTRSLPTNTRNRRQRWRHSASCVQPSRATER